MNNKHTQEGSKKSTEEKTRLALRALEKLRGDMLLAGFKKTGNGLECFYKPKGDENRVEAAAQKIPFGIFSDYSYDYVDHSVLNRAISENSPDEDFKNPRSIFVLLSVAYKSGDFKEQALSILGLLKEIIPKDEYLILKAYSIKEGRDKIDCYLSLLKHGKHRYLALEMLGELYRQLGDTENAIRYHEMYLGIERNEKGEIKKEPIWNALRAFINDNLKTLENLEDSEEIEKKLAGGILEPDEVKQFSKVIIEGEKNFYDSYKNLLHNRFYMIHELIGDYEKAGQEKNAVRLRAELLTLNFEDIIGEYETEYMENTDRIYTACMELYKKEQSIEYLSITYTAIKNRFENLFQFYEGMYGDSPEFEKEMYIEYKNYGEYSAEIADIALKLAESESKKDINGLHDQLAKLSLNINTFHESSRNLEAKVDSIKSDTSYTRQKIDSVLEEIIAIKKLNISDEEKINKLDSDILQKHERHYPKIESKLKSELSFWINLTPDSRTFLATAEFLIENMQEQEFDFSIINIEYSKVMETAIKSKLLCKMLNEKEEDKTAFLKSFEKDKRSIVSNEKSLRSWKLVKNALEYKDFSRLSLGELSNVISTAMITDPDDPRSKFIKSFFSRYTKNEDFVKDRLKNASRTMADEYRNGAAHTKALKKDVAYDCRRFLIMFLTDFFSNLNNTEDA